MIKTTALAAAAGAAIIGMIMITRQKAKPGESQVGDASDVPRGIRNNNPLNIEFQPSNQWDGQTGTDGRFSIFNTPYFGIRAAARLLKNYAANYNIKTVREIIARWAPAVENNVEAYVNSVVKRSGLFPDMRLVEGEYADLIAAMIYHENGQQPYELALIKEATAAGFE